MSGPVDPTSLLASRSGQVAIFEHGLRCVDGQSDDPVLAMRLVPRNPGFPDSVAVWAELLTKGDRVRILEGCTSTGQPSPVNFSTLRDE